MSYYQNNDYLRYNYPNSYYQNQQQYNQNQQYNQTNSGIIWVQGESGAKSYLVAPNSTVQLWDSESQTIYIKSADASGMPSIKILDYKIRENEQDKIKNEINKKQVENTELLENEIEGLNKELENLKKEIENMKNEIHNKSNSNSNKKRSTSEK
jgi:predicted transcriptional regulator